MWFITIGSGGWSSGLRRWGISANFILWHVKICSKYLSQLMNSRSWASCKEQQCQLHLVLNKERPTWCHLLYLLFHYLLLNMFRMLIHPSSGACDLFDELFHGLYCFGSMCVGVTLWFGWGGVVSVCRLKPEPLQLAMNYTLTIHHNWVWQFSFVFKRFWVQTVVSRLVILTDAYRSVP